MAASRDSLVLRLCAKLCCLEDNDNKNLTSPREWRLVGQEQDCSQLFTWISTNETGDTVTSIGLYSETNTFKILHVFDCQHNIIQASINVTHTLLGYVIKDINKPADDTTELQCDFTYKPYILQLKTKIPVNPMLLEESKHQQAMIQFHYKKSKAYPVKDIVDKFMLLIHLDSIKLYTAKTYQDEVSQQTWYTSDILTTPDTIVKSFCWAQWEPISQVLYYIHYRLPVQSSIEGEDHKSRSDTTPTLSGLQFHPDMPHETVLNIPLNLPQTPTTKEHSECCQYEDDAVPLRIHDCSLDLQIVSHPSGIVCICHHYLYKSNDASHKTETLSDLADNSDDEVFYAYSITLLHHGYVIHCIIPNLIWKSAKKLRPSFSLYKDDYLLIHLPNLYTHLLDVGLNHEPCCHITLPPNTVTQGNHLVSILGHGKNSLIDLETLEIVKLNITNAQLTAVFKNDNQIENKLAILHYFIHHDFNIDLIEELLSDASIRSTDTFGTFCSLLKEFLIAGTYVSTKNSLNSAALPLMRLLPFTTNMKPTSVKVGDKTISITQEQLWNTAMMLLSPRQRIVPFRSDMWTRLWDYLSSVPKRFKSHQVLDKLRVSLACYQPEALSRCSTPLSPAGSAQPPRRVTPSFSLQSTQADIALLPFIELDTCTASKQEHVISVNLREVSMHLLKHGSSVGAGQGTQGTATHVHAVASRYAAAQLETSRTLCLVICKALMATAKPDQERGFAFIDSMNDDHRYMLLKALESYYLATDSMAFPLPQGFSSFFTYIGYRTLTFANFLQYVHRNVFELQIDFLKTIISEAGDNTEAVQRAIRLAALGGKGRGRRALVYCSHPTALLLRARDHAATVLAGQAAHLTRPVSNSRTTNTRRGIAAFPSADRLSPLDTFLDLLTAKASLNELDFNLLIDATLVADGQL